MNNIKKAALFVAGCSIIAGIGSCTGTSEKKPLKTGKTTTVKDSLQAYVHNRESMYETVKLTTNLNALTPNQRKVLPLLIQAAQIMDELFWKQTYPQRDSLLAVLKDENTKEFVKINYGPWDRLNGDKPFISGIGARPAGTTFYPAGMTKAEIEKAALKDKFNQYSVIQKDSAGKLSVVPYHVLFAADLQRASSLLKQAALLADDAGLKKYLNLRADALVTDNYAPSDYAWLDMKTNTLDIIIGPIEN
ncbi:MAG TPA: Zn-dependent hydrolase, partial [Pedobacter sp.]